MEKDIVRTLDCHSRADISNTEWLVTNGLGGYASGTVSGVMTRRYHGMLIASHSFRRLMMLNFLEEMVEQDRSSVFLNGDQPEFREQKVEQRECLCEFRLDNGLPVWLYKTEFGTIEKRLCMSYGNNTVALRYSLTEGSDELKLTLTPYMNFRGHGESKELENFDDYTIIVAKNGVEVTKSTEYPSLKLSGAGFDFKAGKENKEVWYSEEYNNGYSPGEWLFSPGKLQARLRCGEEVSVLISTEEWEQINSTAPRELFGAAKNRAKKLISTALPEAQLGDRAELVLAADQFIVDYGREERALSKTVVAGYHWFGDWGRDTMISLEGLTLCTGRTAEAASVLTTFAKHIKNGLIPNLFPEGANVGAYHTADATLWFFHAFDRYVSITSDKSMIPWFNRLFEDIIEHHLNGTDFCIAVDKQDMLLSQGQQDFQLTWMDAKVDGWVVTPRRGKAVEVNALWFNALKVAQKYARINNDGNNEKRYAEIAKRVRESFNDRFWYDDGGYLFDVIDGEQGEDVSLRPNQIFAVSLPNAVLDQIRWGSVLQVVKEKLLTPVGLRTLSQGHPDYKPVYFGTIQSRDAAYHQGTVWPWLIGPFIDAWLKTYPKEISQAHSFLEGIKDNLNYGCIGSINEIFDAEPPFKPKGCIAQAWSVAEVLRSLIQLNKQG
ncbi:amylo-alpha-1,6-glucosidase [Chitinispirillales bacterium ANBcel5]|uniref:amylo-alpha-1,6-glucosidase n=1 Tax=Cellulosispirillum alkaliphilum TaxID=3039283 RepID=UPI002A523E6D|nr:amylo-alpha-1,6-glucosidase [Chitinispirillales bacterium ANBcel5]